VFAADVATPSDHGSVLLQDVDQACCLGVVEHHHVIRPDDLQDLSGIPSHDRDIVIPITIRETQAVPHPTMEVVVNAFGDREEVLVALDDQPARIDACSPLVTKKGLQHLSDPPTRLRRIDVPGDATAQDIPSVLHRVTKALRAGPADDRGEPVKGEFGNVDDLHLASSRTQIVYRIGRSSANRPGHNCLPGVSL
jgi:hypothetical protein